jgi:hypothetical protein
VPFVSIKNDGKLTLVNTPKSLKGDTEKVISESKKYINLYIKWINFKIKNNSWNRNNFVVVRPKRDGSMFSYDFPMMPKTTRKEKCSVGTKIYKVNKLGLRTLLIKIKQEDS